MEKSIDAQMKELILPAMHIREDEVDTFRELPGFFDNYTFLEPKEVGALRDCKTGKVYTRLIADLKSISKGV